MIGVELVESLKSVIEGGAVLVRCEDLSDEHR